MPSWSDQCLLIVEQKCGTFCCHHLLLFADTRGISLLSGHVCTAGAIELMTLSTDELHMHDQHSGSENRHRHADLVTQVRTVLCIITCCIEYIMSNFLAWLFSHS